MNQIVQKSRILLSIIILLSVRGIGTNTIAQDRSFILVGDVHFDKLTLHDWPWLRQNYPNDTSQIINYSQITQNNCSAFITELLHQSQIIMPPVTGIIQMGDLQEGLAGNQPLATQMAIDARDSLRAMSFAAPWILTKGNHEVTGPGGAEAFNSVILPFISAELNKPITTTSYSYQTGDVQVIVIDSYDPNLLTFLKNQLSNSTAKFKIISTHMPVIPVTARLWHIYQNDPVNRDSLLNLIARYKAIVVCGHLHKYSVVKRSTPSGPILQIMVGSVISNRNKHTPDYYVTVYGPSLVDLEPSYDNRGYLTMEAQYITDFRMAEMPGYAVLSLNSTTGGRTLKMYAGLGEYLYETVDLSSYQLRVDTSGMGRVIVTPNDSVFLASTRIILNAEPALGWKFDGWSGDLTGSTNPDTVLMDGDKNITATFSWIPAGQYEVRTKIVGAGTVVTQPAGTPYYSLGTVVTLRARAAIGNRFDGWSGDASGIDTVITVTVNGHKQVTAMFIQLESYQLKTRTNTHGSIILEPSGGTYIEGTQVTLRVQPETGWEFHEWLGDVNGTAGTASITVDGNKEVQALFRKVGGSVQVFGATHDSYVNGFLNAAKNFNADSCLRVREGSSDINRYRTYVQFDVSGVTGNVLGAVLKMRVRNTGLPDGKGIKAGVYAVSTDSWTETTLKWTGAPAAGVLIDSATVSTTGMYYGWDVRSFAAGEVAGDKLVSVMLKDYSVQDKRIDFERREDGQGAVLEIFTNTPTGILEETQGVPREFALHQNYPNPFNPSTEITFDLSRQEYIKIRVNDMTGKEIAILQDGLLNAGHYNRVWDASQYSSGTYFCQMMASNENYFIRMLLLK